MSWLFVLRNCRLCAEAIWAVLTTVGIRRVQIINMLSGDPRTRILAEIFGTRNPMLWAAPVLISQKKRLTRRWGHDMIEKVNTVYVHSILDYVHYCHVIKKLEEWEWLK